MISITSVPDRERPTLAARTTLVASALLVSAGIAHAQTFTGSILARPFTIPGGPGLAPSAETRAADPVRRDEVAPVAGDLVSTTSSAPGRAPEGDRLVRLPASPLGWRVGGETGELSWPVHLTPDESRRTTRFRLTYRTDVSALPDASKVVLSLNGSTIGTVDGQAARPRVTLFDVPAGLLQPGFNAVTLRSEQHHRVDCSLPATYELWTEIDPADTGFVVAAGSADTVLALTDVPALPVRRDGALAVRVVVDGKLQPRDVERVVRAAAALSLAHRTLQPVVDFGPPSADASVNLLVGHDAIIGPARASLGALRALAPGLAISTATTERAATLVVSGPAEQDVEAAISALAKRPAPAGSTAGRRLADGPYGPTATGGESIPLSAFGLRPTIFEGRRFTAYLPLVLPADFLPADYGQVVLDLTGEYGAGLGRGAEILIRVNGRDATSWPMAKAAGAAFSGLTLGLPLSLFRPGPNRIEITALLPGADDGAACSDAAGDRARGRFALSERSSLRVPALARIGRSPELARAAAGGFPAEAGRTLRLVVPQPDRDSLAAAATLAAKFATIQGRVPDIAFSRDGKTPGAGDTLFVAPAQALDGAALAIVGADGSAMQRAWRARAEEVAQARSDPPTTGATSDPRLGGPSACSGDVLRAGAKPAGPRRTGPARAEIVTDPAHAGESGNLAGLRSGLERVARWPAERAVELFRSVKRDPIAPETDDISIFAQGRSGGEQFFAMTAPSSLDLKLAAECLVSPQSWQDVAGRAVLMRASDGAIRSIAADGHAYTSTQPLAIGNMRLIAAGFLSLNPALFVALALALAAFLTFSTRALVRNVGRRSS